MLTKEAIIEAAAAAAHMANLWYCAGLGDESQPEWRDAPEWQKESARKGAALIYDEGPVGPEAQHQCWLDHKKADGWTWGPEKDSVKKRHPCMVPYADLPVSQRMKDTIFGAVVQGVIAFHRTESST